MSTKLYFKTSIRGSSKVEVSFDGIAVAEISVTAVQQAVQTKLGVPIEAQCLVFGGRVLRPEKTLGYYKVTEKSTLYLLPKVEPPESGDFELVLSVQPSPAIIQAQNMLTQILRDPQFMRSVLQRTPALANDAVFCQLLDDPNSALSHPDIVTRFLEEYPAIVSMLVGMRAGGDALQPQGEEAMDYAEGVEPPAYANAQEQMYQHSRALLAHQNSVHGQGTTMAEVHQQAAAAPHPGVTPSDLISAVGDGRTSRAGAMSSVEPVQATIRASDSQNSEQVGTLSVQAGTIHTPHQAPHTITQAQQAPQVPQTITTSYLQRALATAMNATPSPSPPIQLETLQRALLNTTFPAANERRSTVAPPPPSERYRIQLNRLHSMGLTDDAASLHVLEATNGDLDAAMEILLGGMGR